MKESREFSRERKSGKFYNYKMSKSLLKWENQVSISSPRSSGHLALSKRSSGGFFTKKSRV